MWISVALGALALLAVGASPVLAQPLPFTDGKYVTDASLCPLNDDQMIQRHSDMLGDFVRVINGDQLTDAYEMFCTVKKVTVKGNDVRFRALCDGEGHAETVNGRYVRISSTAFRLGGQTFRLCTAGAQVATPAPTSAISSGDWSAQVGQECAGTTVDMMQCVNRLRDQWDRRLNAAYRRVTDAESDPQKSALRNAQRKWISYRDANCAYYAGGQGSIARIEAATCEYALTRERARELEMMTGH